VLGVGPWRNRERAGCGTKLGAGCDSNKARTALHQTPHCSHYTVISLGIAGDLSAIYLSPE
jgi:hypothetical protein